jgi:hypothetical protein
MVSSQQALRIRANAIDTNEDPWLITFRRDHGGTWTTRFYSTTEDLGEPKRIGRRGAICTHAPMCAADDFVELVKVKS